MSEPNFRDKLQSDLDARYAKLLEVIDGGLEAKKKIWTTCGRCNKRTEVEVQDVKGSIEAANFLAQHAHGRPGVAGDGSTDERVIFVRASGDSDALRIWNAAKKFIPADKLELFALEAAYVPEKTEVELGSD
jgi:hypothetical protein